MAKTLGKIEQAALHFLGTFPVGLSGGLMRHSVWLSGTPGLILFQLLRQHGAASMSWRPSLCRGQKFQTPIVPWPWMPIAPFVNSCRSSRDVQAILLDLTWKSKSGFLCQKCYPGFIHQILTCRHPYWTGRQNLAETTSCCDPWNYAAYPRHGGFQAMAFTLQTRLYCSPGTKLLRRCNVCIPLQFLAWSAARSPPLGRGKALAAWNECYNLMQGNLQPLAYFSSAKISFRFQHGSPEQVKWNTEMRGSFKFENDFDDTETADNWRRPEVSDRKLLIFTWTLVITWFSINKILRL